MLTLDGGVETRAFADSVGRFATDTADTADTVDRADTSDGIEGTDAFPWARWRGPAALGAYLVGAGTRAVRASADYAAARRQFGRAIGDFQAVAHPLATAFAQLVATRTLVRMAARAIDDGDAGAPALAASARLGAAD